jgi:hypothetical protein
VGEIARWEEELNLDAKVAARLNSSSSSEMAKQAQLQAIDSLLAEMDSVLAVILDELKAKNWLKLGKTSVAAAAADRSSSKAANYSMQEPTKCTSAVDPLIMSECHLPDDLGFDSRFNRSFSYSFDPTHQLTVSVHNGTAVGNSHRRKRKELRLQKPRLFTSVLISNSAAVIGANVVLFNLETTTATGLGGNGVKKMKRLHQLCEDTARKAINQLRLMHRYFSTPYYLLKYNELTQINKNNRRESSSSSSPSHSDRSHLFWSITLGDCLMADFATNKDTFNLNKYSVIQKSIKKPPLGRAGSQNQSTSSAVTTILNANNTTGSSNQNRNSSKESKLVPKKLVLFR